MTTTYATEYDPIGSAELVDYQESEEEFDPDEAYELWLESGANYEVLPEGYDSWGIKSVRPDLTTRNGFRWPWPGRETAYLKLDDHDDPCPRRDGDGLCVAKTWKGMSAGGFPASTLLLLVYRSAEARGDGDKLRVPQAFVVDAIDGVGLVRESGTNANLRGANLRNADLGYANLWGHDAAKLAARGALLAQQKKEGYFENP